MRSVLLTGAVFAVVLASTVAHGQKADDCIAAAEQAQPLQREGRLRAARELLRMCIRPECPIFVRSDCTKWLAQVDGTMPSFVVHAVDPSGRDLVDVRVLVDGQVVASRLDGRDLEIDPGLHTLRYEHVGSAPIEEHVVAVLGEQHRVRSVAFPSTHGTSSAGAAALAAPPRNPGARLNPAGSSASPLLEKAPESRVAALSTRRPSLLPWILSGGSAIAVGVGGLLWSQGLSMCRSNFSASSPSCDSARADSARGTLMAGDALVGVGLAGVAATVLILVLARPKSDALAPTLGSTRDATALPFRAAF